MCDVTKEVGTTSFASDWLSAQPWQANSASYIVLRFFKSCLSIYANFSTLHCSMALMGIIKPFVYVPSLAAVGVG